MNLKAFFQKLVALFKSDAAAIEHDAATRIQEIASAIPAWTLGKDGSIAIVNNQTEVSMSTTATAQTAAAVQTSNVDTAIQIALALKSIDTSLSTESIQAGTNAALAALYPTT